MKRFAVALVLCAVSLSAQSALIDRGGGFIYDSVLDITWTQNANLRDGEIPLINGTDSWANQVAWAAGLSITDTRPGAGGVVYDDWRLADMDRNGDNTIVDCSLVGETACRDNEFGYLFYQYGITWFTPGAFINIYGANYWSGTDSIIFPFINAWSFIFTAGFQSIPGHINDQAAWAVRAGDVAAVPVPTAVWLFGSAFGLLGWMRRKKV